MPLTDYELNDFRSLFEQDDTRFDVDDFVEYVRTHDYSTNYDGLKAGFIRGQLFEEQFAYRQEQQREAEDISRQAEAAYLERARQLEAEAKQRALQEYIDAGFSPESFEDAWPQIRARLAADKIAERRNRAASPRDHVDGCVPGCRSENVAPPSQG